jgi:hypothetical protein
MKGAYLQNEGEYLAGVQREEEGLQVEREVVLHKMPLLCAAELEADRLHCTPTGQYHKKISISMKARTCWSNEWSRHPQPGRASGAEVGDASDGPICRLHCRGASYNASTKRRRAYPEGDPQLIVSVT